MLTPQDIITSLKALVEENFPGEPVYEHLTPSGFSRPSTLIVLENFEGEVGFGTGGIELRPVFTLTTFVPVDEFHHSHLADLHRRQMRLAAIFLPGFIRVGNRAPKVARPLRLSGGYDFDAVTVTLSYTLSRKEFESMAQVPLMEHLQLETEVRTYE